MNRANLIGEIVVRNPIAPKCRPSHQFVMNLVLIQKELGRMIRKKQDSEMAAQSAGMPIRTATAAPVRNRWRRRRVISTNRRPGNKPIGFAKTVRNFLDNLSQYI